MTVIQCQVGTPPVKVTFLFLLWELNVFHYLLELCGTMHEFEGKNCYIMLLFCLPVKMCVCVCVCLCVCVCVCVCKRK